jgi:hypothetical protein
MGYARDMAETKFPPATRVQMLESKDGEHFVANYSIGVVIRADENGRLEVLWTTGNQRNKKTWVDIARDNLTDAP